MFGGVAASASSIVPAAPARIASVTRPVPAARPDPWQFENANGLGIVGYTHGEDLRGYAGAAGTTYVQYPQEDGYYTYSIYDLCWNTLGGAGDGVAMDSCPPGDTNEWFETPAANGEYVYLKNWLGLCIWGAGSGRAVVLEGCSPTNKRDLWNKINVPS
jgi:hypothetical protein